MSNALNDTTWTLDTAEAVTTEQQIIRRIQWSGATTAGHQAILHDKNGDVIYEAIAAGANHQTESIYEDGFNVKGITLDTLDSGNLYVTIL